VPGFRSGYLGVGNVIPFSAICPDEAVRDQEVVLRQSHPDVVLWWDRMSIAGFLTPDGKQVAGGTPGWWTLRRRTLVQAVDRLGQGGAFIVFVGTEPPGQRIGATSCGSVERCEWRVYQVEHYFDVTARWDDVLRGFARKHPEKAAYIDVSSSVCRVIASPCDDTVGGVSARPDGVHYGGPGIPMVISALLERLRPILASRR